LAFATCCCCDGVTDTTTGACDTAGGGGVGAGDGVVCAAIRLCSRAPLTGADELTTAPLVAVAWGTKNGDPPDMLVVRVATFVVA
jgi:hypothetical protein